MRLFLPVRDPQPAVAVSWITCFHLFTASSGTCDSICGSFERVERYQIPRLFSRAFQNLCNQFQLFWVCFFLVLLGLSSIWFLFPVVPLDLFSLGEPSVSGMHCTWWDHALLLASHPAAPTEKWKRGGRVQMPRPLLGGGKSGRDSTLGHGQVQSPVYGLRHSQAQINTGQRMGWGQPWGEGLGGAGGWEAQHDPAVCADSPAGQPCPGLHPQKRGHRAREGILPLCPTLLRPPRESCVQLWSPQHRTDIEQVAQTTLTDRHCNRLPREVVEVPSLETFEATLNGPLSNLIWLKMSLLTAGVLD